MGYVSTAHDELLELEDDEDLLDDLTEGEEGEVPPAS